jgi:hypothetical protein
MSRLRLIGLVVFGAFFATRAFGDVEGFHRNVPDGTTELYRIGGSPGTTVPTRCSVTRSGKVITLISRPSGENDYDNEFLIYSPGSGGRRLDATTSNVERIFFRDNGVVTISDLHKDSESVIWIPYDGKEPTIIRYGDRIGNAFVNDDGLLVAGCQSGVGRNAAPTAIVFRPGHEVEEIKQFDRETADKRFIVDVSGHLSEAKRMEGPQSPVGKLQAKAAEGIVAPMVLAVDAVNERYGIVYSQLDNNSFQIFSFRQSDGSTETVLDNHWGKSAFETAHGFSPSKITAVELADTGDMVLELSGPKTERDDSAIRDRNKTFLYRRNSNELMDVDRLMPAGLKFGLLEDMNRRGDILFDAIGTGVYFLAADSLKPALVEPLSKLKAPVHLLRLSDDGQIYFWAHLGTDEWVLCRVGSTPYLAIGLAAAPVVLALLIGFWLIRRRRHVRASQGIVSA